MRKTKIIVVVGPTASGKTALGIHVAKKFNGEVISGDSMQIYEDMNIATAKPTEEDRPPCYNRRGREAGCGWQGYCGRCGF